VDDIGAQTFCFSVSYGRYRTALEHDLVRRSGAKSNPRDGLAGGVAQTKVVRLQEPK
jgi:hypothetical protein